MAAPRPTLDSAASGKHARLAEVGGGHLEVAADDEAIAVDGGLGESGADEL